MIVLIQSEGIKDRVVHDVKIVDGKAYLPDHMKPKAEHIAKFYNVKIHHVNTAEELEELTGSSEMFSEAPEKENVPTGNISAPLNPEDEAKEEEEEVEVETKPVKPAKPAKTEKATVNLGK